MFRLISLGQTLKNKAEEDKEKKGEQIKLN